jgi:hypothetical protein
MNNTITQYIKRINDDIKRELNGIKTISVSGCIGYLKPEFDKERTAQRMVDKYYNQEGHRYYHMSKEDIILSWEVKAKEATDRGRLFDSFVEQKIEIRDNNKFNDWSLKHNIDNDEFMQRAMKGFWNVIAHYNSIGYTDVIGTEIPLYIRHEFNNDQIINGRCDCLLYNPNSKHFLIIDWKTNAEIKTTGYEKMYGPMMSFPSCDYYGYMVQLSLYKKALMETYKLGTIDSIHIAICQMGTTDDPYYKVYNDSNFWYTPSLMNSIIDYAYKRKFYSNSK